MNISKQRQTIEKLIAEAENIKISEYNIADQGLCIPDYVDGPQCEKWLNNIYVFATRYLVNHPLYNSICEIYNKRKQNYSAFDEMLVILHSIREDEDFDNNSEIDDNNLRPVVSNESQTVFISHRTTDKEAADLLCCFLQDIGNMHLNCTLGDHEQIGDLLVGSSADKFS